MKLRATFSVLAIAAAVSACSSSSSGGGTPAGGTSTGGGAVVTSGSGASAGAASGDFCANLTSAQTKLTNLSTAGSSGDFNALKAAIGEDITAFQNLANGAPADVKPALDDIVTNLQVVESAVADPTHPDTTKLAPLATKMPADITKLTNYVASNC